MAAAAAIAANDFDVCCDLKLYSRRTARRDVKICNNELMSCNARSTGCGRARYMAKNKINKHEIKKIIWSNDFIKMQLLENGFKIFENR